MKSYVQMTWPKETYKASILLASSIVELTADLDTVQSSSAMSHKPAQMYQQNNWSEKQARAGGHKVGEKIPWVFPAFPEP